jgi:hypothetical protein
LIPPPKFQIQQVSSEARFELTFDKPTLPMYNVTSIRVQYRPVKRLPASFLHTSKETDTESGVEELNTDGKSSIILRDSLKPVRNCLYL